MFRNDFSIRIFFKCCLWQAQSHLTRQHLFCFSYKSNKVKIPPFLL
ncbi:hypothetical protein EFM7_2132 [Enterococcus faecalis M7]|nr:hypothetical protein EFM7_2132 [Enterococcus faecalis M7]